MPCSAPTREADAEKAVALRAGPLRMVLHNGEIRRVRLGRRQIVQRVYFAVRDQHWDTLPIQLSGAELHARQDGFVFLCRCQGWMKTIEFEWTQRIEGRPDGSIRWQFDGNALSDFLSSRIGFCVLHPVPECAGKLCRIESRSGEAATLPFPVLIAPRPVFSDFTRLSYALAPGIEVDLRFHGDTFETEDQRNWTDASYKTYSRPLCLPSPFQVHAGESFQQSLEISTQIQLPDSQESFADDSMVRISVDTAKHVDLPALGLQFHPGRDELTPQQVELLKNLRLSHLRIDAGAPSAASESALSVAFGHARKIGVPLEIAVHHAANEAWIRRILVLLEASGCCSCRWLLFSDRGACEELRDAIWRITNTEVAIGTNKDFVEINRNRAVMMSGPTVCFTMNPQVHASDDWSVMENLAAQGWVVQAAKALTRDAPIAISPVTLKPRFNPHVTDWPLPGGTTEDTVDARQQTLFGAAWTLGSLKHLAASEARSVTYYETTGPSGVMPASTGAANTAKCAGSVYPMYHVFADVGEYRTGRVLPLCSSDPYAVDGMAIVTGKNIRVLIANLMDEKRTAHIDASSFAGKVLVKRLNACNKNLASTNPLSFRSIPGEAIYALSDTLKIDLSGYELVRIDGALKGELC